LKARLGSAASANDIGAVFHAAAVSDFGFGKILQLGPDGKLQEVRAGKISTRERGLVAELIPTAKIISDLRRLFPKAVLVGWKFEVDGDRASVIEAARRQLEDSRTDGCVANGPAYGDGFALVRSKGETVHLENKADLFKALEGLIQ